MKNRWIYGGLLLAFCSLLFACSGGGDGGGGATTTTGTGSPAFTVTDATGKMTVSVPTGAYDSTATQPNITIAKVATLPAGAVLPANADPANVYELTKTNYPDSFLQPVEVTVPYDPTVNDMPTVLYYDTVNNNYVAAPVKNIDPVAKTITFSTVHFSHYVVTSDKDIKNSSSTLPAVDTLFDPLKDGFAVPNFGSYTVPGGCSLGMSDFAVWYYTNMKGTAGNLYDKWLNDPTTARQVIAASQKAASQIWAKFWNHSNYKVDKKKTGLLLIASMKLSGKPQSLFMKSVVNGVDKSALAVTAFKFTPDTTTPTKGKFSIYDPNFPGETATLDWDMATGFSNYSKAGAYSEPFTNFAFDGLPSIAESKQFKSLYDSVTNTAVLTSITLTSPAFDSTGTYSATVTGTTLPDVTVAGSVTGTATTLSYVLNGGALQNVTLSGGTFSFILRGADLKTDNTLILSAAGSIRNPWSFNGFKQLKIRFTGTNVSVFNNFGFETGDTTGWTLETHLWSDVTRNLIGLPFKTANTYGDYLPNGTVLPACTPTDSAGALCYNPDWGTIISFTPNTVTPGKSSIVSKTTSSYPDLTYYGGTFFDPTKVTAGVDPVIDFYQKNNGAYGTKAPLGQASSLAIVFNSLYALRINNWDYNYHASSASQTATIPNVAAPEIRFAWAAVLEDPQHDRANQPYVEILVFDEDAQKVIFRKHFFSGDPSYSGWVPMTSSYTPTYTLWNIIPWQTMVVDVSSAVGHKVKVRVSASDCGYGGHGGYAYLDDSP